MVQIEPRGGLAPLLKWNHLRIPVGTAIQPFIFLADVCHETPMLCSEGGSGPDVQDS